MKKDKANRKALVHFTAPPYASQTFKEGLDLALVLATFQYHVTLFFSGEAVWSLCKNQSKQETGPKIVTDGLKALALYDINRVVVDTPSLIKQSLDKNNLLVDTEQIQFKEVQETFATQDIIFTY